MKYGTLEKKQSNAFGKDVYLLGKDVDGVAYWLESPSWDCGWYWGFGYIETYTSNMMPSRSKDINSHQHAGDFMKWAIEWNGKDPKLKETTFSDNEAWQLSELFKRFELFKELAGYYHRGGAQIATIKNEDSKKDAAKTKQINEVEIPYITGKILEILKP